MAEGNENVSELAKNIRRNLKHLKAEYQENAHPSRSKIYNYIDHMDTLAEEIESRTALCW